MNRKATPWRPAMGALATLLLVPALGCTPAGIDAAWATAGPLVESLERAP